MNSNYYIHKEVNKKDTVLDVTYGPGLLAREFDSDIASSRNRYGYQQRLNRLKFNDSFCIP